jgi:hypothetical protein
MDLNKILEEIKKHWEKEFEIKLDNITNQVIENLIVRALDTVVKDVCLHEYNNNRIEKFKKIKQ